MASELQNLALARSLLDRAAHLRTSDQTLDELFAKAKIFQVNQGKFIWSAGKAEQVNHSAQANQSGQPNQSGQASQNKSDSAVSGLVYLEPDSAQIKSPEFAESVAERFFLGLAPNGQPFFAINAPFPDGTENLVSLRDVGTILNDLEINSNFRSVGFASSTISKEPWKYSFSFEIRIKGYPVLEGVEMFALLICYFFNDFDFEPCHIFEILIQSKYGLLGLILGLVDVHPSCWLPI